MKLIGSYTSPFVRKISVIMLEKGMMFEFVNASPYSEDSHVPQYNPLGKVPALVAEDQQVWFDSSIIAEYLELRGQAPALLPADPLASLKVRQLEKLADGISDAALVIVREQMRSGNAQSEEVLLRHRDKIQRGLDSLEKEVSEGKWIDNGELNLADIATGCMIGYLNFRRVVPNWCVQRPALVRLAETLFQRESFARTTPPAS
ncbi:MULTISPECIES: glutathione S-transferase [Pantoea]|uniref:Glutathione S-transferase n=1 Tax=Pantoea stewartii subsp. stewartii DC283 TaxID=660596 RepID=H3RIQ0_PANSE|nr:MULTISPECIES: glutathione S-transferase [Pantoea]ARF51771.1 glutathione S-transferase [Pantoea stewartii subsp. stewartii DC283]EHT98758.1 putative glutathione S-transferase [Pantoea stewartii subsp. stewartii DC283]KAB0558142.1 glutathione S-transferase [Pantoea stewartii subsp. stewartii]KHE02533.1 glutathione S-transferase [Pantoea stewartii]KHN63863.1 glutathione S-transferase [Pantoea stewartii]